MANETSTKVRLVRCPNCRQILQEHAEIPVYKCGGCGTVLQAKKKKNENSSGPESSTHETTPASNERGENSLEKGISSLHKKAVLSPPDDALQDENEKRNRDEYGDSSKEQCGEKVSYGELHRSLKLGNHENKDNLSSIREPVVQRGDECHLNGSSGGCENLTGERSFPDELHNSNQLKTRETSAPFPLPRARELVEEVDKEKFPLDQNDGGAGDIKSPESRSSHFTRCIHRDSAVNSSRGIFSAEIACDNIRAESVSSESVVPIHHEHHGNSDKEIALGFDSSSSTDSLQNILIDDNRSQPAITHRSYYAYDGSISSCDGDDQMPNHFSRQYGQISGNAGLTSPDEFQSDYICTANNMLRRKPPVLPQMIQQVAEGRNWLESRRRLEKDMKSRELGSPSGYKKNVVHHQSGFHTSSVITDPEPDRTELLRMVYELEEKLRRTRLGNGNANNAPFFHNQFAPARCGQSSRLPFSGEAAHYRQQANCLCLHCSPQVWHCSAQLPQGCIYCNTHHSGSSSPQHYASSEYSSSVHDTKSSDQRHKDQETKRKLQYAKRRLVLPVAGGAPIIACHYCSELLQMPADFGLFKRRWHQVRCNACMKVLKFSVQNRIHVMPYLAETSTPPPSDVDDISKGKNQAPASHAESVSYSDDLKPSFCLSGSSEAEASSNSSPIQPHGRKVLSSPSSSEPMEDGKMKSRRVKSSSEGEGALPRTGPPLHRLMGYSTLSQVLNQKCFE